MTTTPSPSGFFRLSAQLREHFDVRYLDALDRFHPAATEATARPDGTGNYHSAVIPKPALLADIPRRFRRYGLPDAAFQGEIAQLPEKPAFIFVTGGMTYWYSGLSHTIRLLRTSLPGVPVLLGGTYPSILPEHAAAHSGGDFIVPGRRMEAVLPLLEDILGVKLARGPLTPEYPRVKLPYAAVMSGEGCPFRCDYCASQGIGEFRPEKPESVAETIISLFLERGMDTFAWYDDALLYRHEEQFDLVLEILAEKGLPIRQYTPNGLHVRYLSERTLALMRATGFAELRLSLETAKDESRFDVKTRRADFERAMALARKAGFGSKELRVYLLSNLPGQKPEEVAQTMEYAASAGGTPMLAWYSPIPGTPLFAEAMKISDVSEPLAQNNVVYRYRGGWSETDYRELKRLELGYRK